MTKPTLVYIGNKLGKHGLTPGTIELLSEKLSCDFTIHSASDVKHPILRVWDMLHCIWKYRKVCRFVLIDTYSTSAFFFAWACGMLCRILHLPYIPILHGGYLPVRLKKNPEMSHHVFGYAYKLIAPSDYMKTEFEKHGYTRVCTVPNFIPVAAYPYTHRSSATPSLIWVRSFHATYNPIMAINVMKVLHDSGIKASLIMTGPDKDGTMQQCKQLTQTYGLDAYITFTGRLSKAEWIELAQSCSIFINTTHVDNTPVSVIEAMALGLCVVSTRVGGIPYLIQSEKNGLLVSDNDVNEMVNRIIQLLQEPELVSAISAEARNTAMQWSWEKVYPLWKDVLHTRNI